MEGENEIGDEAAELLAELPYLSALHIGTNQRYFRQNEDHSEGSGKSIMTIPHRA